MYSSHLVWARWYVIRVNKEHHIRNIHLDSLIVNIKKYNITNFNKFSVNTNAASDLFSHQQGLPNSENIDLRKFSFLLKIMSCVVCIQLVNTIFLTWQEHMRKSWESTTGKETLSKASDKTWCQPTMHHILFVSILFTVLIIYHQKTKVYTTIQNTHSYKVISQFFQEVPFLETVDVHSVEGYAWNVALATENEVTPGAGGVGEHLVALREQALFRMRSYTKY